MSKCSILGKIFTVALASATAVCAVEWFTDRLARNFLQYSKTCRRTPAPDNKPCADELEEAPQYCETAKVPSCTQ